MGLSRIAAAMPNYPNNNGSPTTVRTVEGVLHATLHTQRATPSAVVHASGGAAIWPWFVLLGVVVIVVVLLLPRVRHR